MKVFVGRAQEVSLYKALKVRQGKVALPSRERAGGEISMSRKAKTSVDIPVELGSDIVDQRASRTLETQVRGR